MTPPLIPVILAGGKGERFWPLSRRKRPKQFLSLDGSGDSLLQATAKRLLSIAQGWENLWVITSALVADGVTEQLPELPLSNLLVEPEGRDTAPAVAWATLEVAKKYGEETVIGFFPADHWIADQSAFEKILTAASQQAREFPSIVTLGITPTYPSTGYGYIQQGQQINTSSVPVYKVSRFTEKPERPTAESFLASGDYSWNSGMFIFRASVVISELEKYVPEIIKPLQAQGVSIYPQLEKKSIDYALMEKTQLAYIIPAEFPWDDLGDWNAIERLLQGEKTNVELAQHLGLESENCIFYASDSNELIVTIGLKDLVVVRDKNVTLIVQKERTQDIKQVLKQIQAKPDLDSFL